MLVLFTAHERGYSDRVRSVGYLETAKSHRHANSRLPAHQLEDGTYLDGKGNKKHAPHGVGGSHPWDLFIYLCLADKVK